MNAKEMRSLTEDSLYESIKNQIERAARDGRLSTDLYPRTVDGDKKTPEPIYDVVVARLKEEGFNVKIETPISNDGHIMLAISWDDA